MGNVHLVTGFAGKSHVTAVDHASLFEAAFRSGQFVMNSGNNFKASLISANQVRISDGEMIMQGRFVRINPAAYEDVAIENGAQGYLRNDLIVMRYTRDADTGIESIGLVAIKGQAVAADPADPRHQVGDINDGGSLINDFPLYRIPLDGLNVGDPVALFTLQPSIYDLYTAYKAATDKSLSQLSADKAPAGYGLGTQNQSKVTTLEQLDNMGHSGWYDVQLSTEKIKNYTRGTLCVNAGYHVIEQVFAPWTQNFKLIRYWDYECGWSEWAYDSPPMLLGEEYRTTERWNGKVVYTIAIGTGQLPNNSVLSLTDCYTATNIIRASGATNNGPRMSFPAKWQEWDSTSNTILTKEIGLMAASWGTSVFTNYDASSVNATIQIWYTKD